MAQRPLKQNIPLGQGLLDEQKKDSSRSEGDGSSLDSDAPQAHSVNVKRSDRMSGSVRVRDIDYSFG